MKAFLAQVPTCYLPRQLCSRHINSLNLLPTDTLICRNDFRLRRGCALDDELFIDGALVTHSPGYNLANVLLCCTSSCMSIWKVII